MTESNDDRAKPVKGFWEGFSTDPPREGDKLKAVLMGLGLALLVIAISFVLYSRNSGPLQ